MHFGSPPTPSFGSKRHSGQPRESTTKFIKPKNLADKFCWIRYFVGYDSLIIEISIISRLVDILFRGVRRYEIVVGYTLTPSSKNGGALLSNHQKVVRQVPPGPTYGDIPAVD